MLIKHPYSEAIEEICFDLYCNSEIALEKISHTKQDISICAEQQLAGIEDDRELKASLDHEARMRGILKSGREVIFRGATSIYCLSV